MQGCPSRAVAELAGKEAWAAGSTTAGTSSRADEVASVRSERQKQFGLRQELQCILGLVAQVLPRDDRAPSVGKSEESSSSSTLMVIVTARSSPPICRANVAGATTWLRPEQKVWRLRLLQLERWCPPQDCVLVEHQKRAAHARRASGNHPPTAITSGSGP